MSAPTASGMDDVVVAHTALSDVDGERGQLVIPGYSVETGRSHLRRCLRTDVERHVGLER